MKSTACPTACDNPIYTYRQATMAQSMSKALIATTLLLASIQPLSAQADSSKCTKKIQSMGYFITDIDSDWGRPYDKFSAVKNGKEYDIWVNKSSCVVEQIQLDDDRSWYD